MHISLNYILYFKTRFNNFETTLSFFKVAKAVAKANSFKCTIPSLYLACI